jgi:hypothetical protein
MNEDLGNNCRNCGVAFHNQRSRSKYEDCKGITMFDLVPKKVKGEVCELYVMGLKMVQIQKQMNLPYAIVSKIIEKYLGIGEQPILLTFTTE